MPQDISSNNKRIAKNTLALYLRTFITMLIGLYTGRVMLQALGVDNYGINSVVGGIIGFSTIITGAMGEGISRFLTFSLGRDNVERQKTVFSTCINAQIFIALIVVLSLEIIGVWFLNTTANIPENRMFAANWVLQCSIITLAIGLVSSPYSALIVAHERMGIYAYMSIVDVLLKLAIVFTIIAYDGDRLIMLSSLNVLVAVLMCSFYNWYSLHSFIEARYNPRNFDKSLYREMLSFSGWNLGGYISWIFSTQGISMLMNVYFGVTFNAARGIAMTINQTIQGFVGNFTVSFTPQITKSYAAGDLEYAANLANRGTKFTWLLMFLFITPVFMEADMLLNLWLGTPPEHASLFLRFAMFEALSIQISQTVLSLIRATGKVKRYFQIVFFWSGATFPLAWFCYYLGAPAWSAYLVFILVYLSITGLRLWYIKRVMPSFLIGRFITDTLKPGITVSIASFTIPALLSFLMQDGVLRFFVMSIVSVSWTLLCIIVFGLSKSERQFFFSKARTIMNKFLH